MSSFLFFCLELRPGPAFSYISPFTKVFSFILMAGTIKSLFRTRSIPWLCKFPLPFYWCRVCVCTAAVTSAPFSSHGNPILCSVLCSRRVSNFYSSFFSLSGYVQVGPLSSVQPLFFLISFYDYVHTYTHTHTHGLILYFFTAQLKN